MTPGSHCYLDHSQSKNEDSVTIGGYLPLEKVYSYEPVPAVLNAEQAKHILGAQGNVWTEYMGYPSKVEYMIFPRMMALSEVLWSPKNKRDWKDFERRLPTIYKRIESATLSYSKAYYDLQATVIPSEDNSGVLWKIESKNPKDKIAFLNGTEDNKAQQYKGPIKPILSGYVCSAWIQSDDFKIVGNVLKQKFTFNKATGKKITLVNQPSSSYPGDGAFTLVNGVQNEMKLSRSNEFLGFNGTDLDATIDLGKITDIKKVTLHILEQPGSWIYAPSKVEVQYLNALETDDKPMMGKTIANTIDVEQGKGTDKIAFESVQSCRYIRVIAKNYGIIPTGNPGAGNPAWLFADEIEVE
jgi:hexosaminidase